MTKDCPYHFGYLSQRSRGEEIPEECVICKKVVECMLSKPKIEQLEKIHTSAKSISATPEMEITMFKEIGQSAEKSAQETVKKDLFEPEIKIKTEPSGNQFTVENLDMLYSSLSNTVRIDIETLSRWGRKIREVEIETLDGKRMRCKVYPMEDSKKGIIQIPEKMQLNLEIEEGKLVRVKPVTGLQKEEKRSFFSFWRRHGNAST